MTKMSDIRFFRPAPELRPYVRYYWAMRGSSPLSALTFPIGCPQLIFHREEPLYVPELGGAQPRFAVSGQVNFPARLESGGNLSMLVAVFYPHAFQALFGLDAADLYNREIDAGLLSVDGLSSLYGMVVEAPGDAEGVRLVEQWLLARVGRIVARRALDFRRIGSALEMMLRSPGTRVADLAGAACLSGKQFQRTFFSTVGMLPKEYSRIVRFQKALHHLQVSRPSDTSGFARTAYVAGYSDQSHFIRECRRLSGHTPARLIAVQPPYSDLFTDPLMMA